MENYYTRKLRTYVGQLTTVRDKLEEVLSQQLTADLVYDDSNIYKKHRDAIVREVNNLGNTIRSFDTYITRCETYNKTGW
ncbi:MAG: hypothetical protein II625_00760 [Bacilli bacterium]|nr:hypothetical protein [Bacilli bacterium]